VSEVVAKRLAGRGSIRLAKAVEQGAV
jgi:hypothetical protein